MNGGEEPLLFRLGTPARLERSPKAGEERKIAGGTSSSGKGRAWGPPVVDDQNKRDPVRPGFPDDRSLSASTTSSLGKAMASRPQTSPEDRGHRAGKSDVSLVSRRPALCFPRSLGCAVCSLVASPIV